MPFVRRQVRQKVESTQSEIVSDHELYVKPSRVERGDVIIPPEELPDPILADLAARFPKEYGKAALARGVKPLEEEPEEDGVADEDDDVDDEEEFTEEQQAFLLLSDAEAVKRVQESEDVDQLAAWLEAELARPKARAAVLKAFEAKAK